jgi:hypothetical protein
MRAERGHFRDMKKRDLMTDTLTRGRVAITHICNINTERKLTFQYGA